jgi:hypothetical protein
MRQDVREGLKRQLETARNTLWKIEIHPKGSLRDSRSDWRLPARRFYTVLYYACMPKEIPKEIPPELYEVYDNPARVLWLQRLICSKGWRPRQDLTNAKRLLSL